MDRPPPNPRKLLDTWMEWEKGEELPGRVMSTLKTAGMRDLLEQLVAAEEPVAATADEGADTGSWSPVV
jgi:hypothetical protein